MKALLIFGLGFLSFVFSLQAEYSVDWFQVAGGNGESTNGHYSLKGTIGEGISGAPMAGGDFSLTGGVGVLYAIQTSKSPALTIFRTMTNTVVISWPSFSAGFNLQVNATLNAASWSNAPQSVTDDGTRKQIIVNQSPNNRYYRLFRP